MKKIITILTVLLTVIISSCSNDEIPVDRTVKFILNPATVVENLPEVNAGDLTSLDKESKLNIDLYIYDEFGQLISKDNQEVKSYTNITTSHINLSNGEYTIVAISHITTTDVDGNAVQLWSFEGLDNLNTFKITDNGYYAGKFKILGLTIQKINITDIDKSFNIDIKCAGVVTSVLFKNIKIYNNIKNLVVLSNKNSDYITTRNNGEIEYSYQSNSEFEYILANIKYNSKYNNMYSYLFTFPTKDMSLILAAITNEDPYIFDANVMNFTLGKSYRIEYDLKTEKAEWLEFTSKKMLEDSVLGNQNSASSKPSIVYDYENMSISIK